MIEPCSNAVLDRADLSHASFYKCDLRGASVRETRMDGTDFTECQIAGADFTGSTGTVGPRSTVFMKEGGEPVDAVEALNAAGAHVTEYISPGNQH